MGALGDAVAELKAAVLAIEEFNLYAIEDASSVQFFPAVIIGPPRLSPGGSCIWAAEAEFPVYLQVALADNALELLLDLAPMLAEGIEEFTQAVVTSAFPSAGLDAGPDLPTYELTVSYAL